SFGPKFVTVMVYVTSVSAAWLFGPVLRMLTSAELPPATFVPVVDMSFSGLSSGLPEAAVTVLISVVPAAFAATLATMSNCALVPAVSVPIVHVTVPVEPIPGLVQVKDGTAVWLMLKEVVSAGRAS